MKTDLPITDPHHDRRWLILGVIGIAQLLVVLDVTIVNIALPSAQADLGFSDDDRQWIITAYALAFGSLLLLGGRIADLFGRKWTFIAGLLGFAGASALGGAAQSFGLLVAARALQGVFAALLAPAALSLLATTFTDPAERGKAFGVYGAIAGAGGAFGLLLGGFLTEVLDWRWCLYVSILFAVPAAVAALRLLHHMPAPVRPRLDIPGTLIVSSGLFALVFGMARAESDGWGDPVTLAFLGASVVLLAAFVALQRRVANPLLPLRVVTDRDRGGSYLAIATAGAGIFGVFLFLTFYLQNTMGMTALETGLAFLPMNVVIIFTATLVNTRVLARTGPRPLVPTGMLARRARDGAADADRRRHRVRVARAALADPDRARLRPRRRTVVRDRDARRAAPGHRRRVRDGQHVPAGGWLDRHRAAQHDGGVRDERLSRGERAAARPAGHRRGLHDGVLVGGGDLRRRRARHRQPPALPCAT